MGLPKPFNNDCAVITVSSGTGGVGKTTVAQILAELMKNKHRINLIDDASDFTRNNYFDKTKFFERLSCLSIKGDVIIIDTPVDGDKYLPEVITASDILLLVVTPDLKSIESSYAICKYAQGLPSPPQISFFLNMADSETDYLEFNLKINLLTQTFLKKEIIASGYLKFDKLFSQSPRDIEFGSMINNDNRFNSEEFIAWVEDKLSKRREGVLRGNRFFGEKEFNLYLKTPNNNRGLKNYKENSDREGTL